MVSPGYPNLNRFFVCEARMSDSLVFAQAVGVNEDGL